MCIRDRFKDKAEKAIPKPQGRSADPRSGPPQGRSSTPRLAIGTPPPENPMGLFEQPLVQRRITPPERPIAGVGQPPVSSAAATSDLSPEELMEQAKNFLCRSC